MDNIETKLRNMLDSIEELLSLASEDLLKAKKYGGEKERIERELTELVKSLDERDQLGVEKVIPKWRPEYKSDAFLSPNEVNGISPLRNMLFQLLAKYYQPRSTPQSKNEAIIASGKPYDGIRYLRSILSQARQSIFIRDNYLRPDILNILSEYLIDIPLLKIRLLIAHHKRTPAFRSSYKAFQAQYPTEIESRIIGEEGKDHPRYILIDETTLFTPDHSLDRWGIETVNIYKHEDPKGITEVRARLETEWSNASPL